MQQLFGCGEVTTWRLLFQIILKEPVLRRNGLSVLSFISKYDEWFCRNAGDVAVDYGRITRGWMMSFNGMVQMGMMELGRGGACVPARVAPRGRIHR